MKKEAADSLSRLRTIGEDQTHLDIALCILGRDDGDEDKQAMFRDGPTERHFNLASSDRRSNAGYYAYREEVAARTET